MSFTAATGSNYQTANAFCDVAYADDYFSLRGISAWTGSTSAKQAAIIKATDYIEQTYGQRFTGIVGNYPQLLSWPRYNAGTYDTDEIPENLKKATCELALEALTKDLNPVITTNAAVKREKVDVIETEYFEAKNDQPIRPAVIGYLSPLLNGSSFNRQVIRV